MNGLVVLAACVCATSAQVLVGGFAGAVNPNPSTPSPWLPPSSPESPLSPSRTPLRSPRPRLSTSLSWRPLTLRGRGVTLMRRRLLLPPLPLPPLPSLTPPASTSPDSPPP